MRPVGRFAPSPTGALHTGSLVAATGSYLMAKHQGGEWFLRVDDLDSKRQIPGVADDIMRTLESLGLLWDGTVARQSKHLEEYEYFFSLLQKNGKVYPCGCSRKEIAQSSSAPHTEDDCIPYSGRCRAKMLSSSVIRSWRLIVPDDEICFYDLRKGEFCQSLPAVSGDFVLRRGDGEFAYQLAVVVDDYLAGVNQVVRGEDILGSTPRQIYLQRLLGFAQPEYCHLPLVCGSGGTKLSKRDHLISDKMGDIGEIGQKLLFEVLRFLGQKPPTDLVEYPCKIILQWGVANFSQSSLPPLQSGIFLI